MSSFIASNTFSGAKPNYKFQQGDQGIGYYLDVDTQPLLVSIDVPVGAGPGDVLEIQHPNTQDWVKVTLPEGSTSGNGIIDRADCNRIYNMIVYT